MLQEICRLKFHEESDTQRDGSCFLPSKVHKSFASDVTSEDFFIELTIM
jgi:hypothetical protein